MTNVKDQTTITRLMQEVNVLTAALREQPSRNDVLEEVAQEFDKMKVLGDTAASFAAYVRGMKKQENFEVITCRRCGKSIRVNTFDEYSGIHTCTPQQVTK